MAVGWQTNVSAPLATSRRPRWGLNVTWSRRKHKLLQNVEGLSCTVALLRRNDPLHYGRGLGFGAWAAASRSLETGVAADMEVLTSGGAVFRCLAVPVYVAAMTCVSLTDISLISR